MSAPQRARSSRSSSPGSRPRGSGRAGTGAAARPSRTTGRGARDRLLCRPRASSSACSQARRLAASSPASRSPAAPEPAGSSAQSTARGSSRSTLDALLDPAVTARSSPPPCARARTRGTIAAGRCLALTTGHVAPHPACVRRSRPSAPRSPSPPRRGSRFHGFEHTVDQGAAALSAQPRRPLIRGGLSARGQAPTARGARGATRRQAPRGAGRRSACSRASASRRHP